MGGRRRLALLLLLPLALLALAAGLAGERLSRPVPGRVGAPPPGASAVLLPPTDQGQPVSGWLMRGRPGAGVVLLLHGLRSDRRQMLGRAAFLQRLGYSLLLIDLPGHGESPGEHLSFGAKESEGVRAALAWLARELPAERVGVIGVSLGAASLVLARGPRPAPAAVVLESMYPAIEEAVADRLRLHLGDWAAPLAPLLLWQLPLRLGVSAEQLRPIERLPELGAPLLLATGSMDRHTPLAAAVRLFAAAHEPKELWVLEGAGHVDLHRFNPRAYETKVAAFLARHLRPPD